MRGSRDYLHGFVQLHHLRDAEDRLATWRQSIATLAAEISNHGRAAPLEGLNPDALIEGVRAALHARLVDDLDWLSGPASAAALYELAAALPVCEEKRELGRRVLARLHRGNASTFVALATQLALGSKRALGGASLRARVALSLDLPIGTGTQSDGLALALISRRELSREWLTIPSTGSLPSRRLAARLLERAAREAARRATEGDESGVRVFDIESVRTAWDRLLADRESLVWRHIASARGLLSASVPSLEEQIHENLSPRLGITEWRRASASLAASIALRPDDAYRKCERLLESEVFERDRGVAGAMVFGLPRAAEREPDAVEELLEQVVKAGGLFAAETLIDARRERAGTVFGKRAGERARTQLREALRNVRPGDDGRIALAQAVADELDDDANRRPTLRDMISAALERFADQGPNEARELAARALAEAKGRMNLLERCLGDGPKQRHASFRALRELDMALLESDTLSNLLALDVAGEASEQSKRPLGDIFERLTNWLVIHEGEPVSSGRFPHLTLRLRRLRTMLHLVDADGVHVEPRSALLRKRRLVSTRILLSRTRNDPRSPLSRALCAAVARACEAVVREEIGEVSDILLLVGMYVQSREDLNTMLEASMAPDMELALRAYLKLSEVVRGMTTSTGGAVVGLDALAKVAQELPVASSPRVEALRASLLDLVHALEKIAACGSLSEVAEHAQNSPLEHLESSVAELTQLVSGARRRMGDIRGDHSLASDAAIRVLGLHIERELRGEGDSLDDAVHAISRTIENELPYAIARVAVSVLGRISRLPLDAPRRNRPSLRVPGRSAPLPAWMPPGRVLGGFFVTRAIGTGAVGSVFVACRAEERQRHRAEQFALKVPDYTGAAARTLSEEQFLHMFREEAGALLSLPQHPNLARFVTFDAGVRPKPILVMELVEGPNLQRLIELGNVNMMRAFDVIEGVASGLEAMHAVGIGHLDLKPSNVIMKEAQNGARPNGAQGNARDVPVLVDFGLAGRNLRPGCGTAEYGAPEVWGQPPGATAAKPVDVYALGCLMYELVTGTTLFDAPNEVALIAAHIAHDGTPTGVDALATDPRTARLAEVIRKSLRRDPERRATVSEIRSALARIRPEVVKLEWPIGVG